MLTLIRVTVEIGNSGKTPAYVTGGLLKLDIRTDQLPAAPNYENGKSFEEDASSFLAAEGKYYVHWRDPLTNQQAEAARGGQSNVYLYGYVEYIDVFNVAHRSGYARRYLPSQGENNLVFVGGTAYNYDNDAERVV